MLVLLATFCFQLLSPASPHAGVKRGAEGVSLLPTGTQPLHHQDSCSASSWPYTDTCPRGHQQSLTSIEKPTMENKVIPNPIPPVAGVHRNTAADGGAGPPLGWHYDDRTSNPRGVINPQGRVLSDHSTLSKALLRCRRPFIMGTFNAWTVREDARLLELAHRVEERGVEILRVQEHRTHLRAKRGPGCDRTRWPNAGFSGA